MRTISLKDALAILRSSPVQFPVVDLAPAIVDLVADTDLLAFGASRVIHSPAQRMGQAQGEELLLANICYSSVHIFRPY
jgi:hypothetical protein